MPVLIPSRKGKVGLVELLLLCAFVGVGCSATSGFGFSSGFLGLESVILGVWKRRKEQSRRGLAGEDRERNKRKDGTYSDPAGQ